MESMTKWRPGRPTDGGDDLSKPVTITEARQSYEEEHAARVRRYLLLMSVRIPSLLLAGAAYMIWENGLLSLAIVAASIPIPWIAVLGANDRPPLPKDKPRPYAGASGFTVPAGYALPPAVTGSVTDRERAGTDDRPTAASAGPHRADPDRADPTRAGSGRSDPHRGPQSGPTGRMAADDEPIIIDVDPED